MIPPNEQIIGGPNAPHTWEDSGGTPGVPKRQDGYEFCSIHQMEYLECCCSRSLTMKTNVLFRTRCYLIGGMQYVDGKGWREIVESSLNDRNITFFNPYFKPFIHDVPENDIAREELKRWMETEQYDLVQQRMWEVRGYDLRLCDICDFFIAHINPEVASWGSAEEIITVIREKKPIFLSVEGGKAKTPLWLMGAIPHKYIYNNIQEIIETIRYIDDGVIKMNSSRWKLLRKELR
jgi:hypothetical protein